LIVCGASWIKGDPAANDFERFDDLRLTITFLVLFSALSLVYAALVEAREPISRRWLYIGLIGCSLPLLLSFPVGSKDVFLYAIYGKMWGTHGLNPYLQSPSRLAGENWLRLIPWENARVNPAPYGPLFIHQTHLVWSLVGDRLWAVVATYKLINLFLLVPSAILIGRVAGHVSQSGSRAAAFWLLSPLVLFESLSAGHNDLAMTTLILAAIFAWLRERSVLAYALLGLSFWFKWYSVFLLPVWIAWSFRRWSSRRTLRDLVFGLLVVLLESILLLAPFQSSLPVMVARVLSHENVRTIYPTELPPPLWVAFQVTWRAGLFDSPAGHDWFDAARFALCGAALIWLVLRRRGMAYAPRLFIEDLLWSLALFLGLVVTILWPWHLLPVCALALALVARSLERAAAALTAVGLLSYFLTFTLATLGLILMAGSLRLMRAGRTAR
jgi:hypothetical protein